MEKKLIFSLLVFIFLAQIVSAVDTEIKIKTLPNHEVLLTVLDSTSSSSTVLKRFINNSDEYGDISFIFSSDKSRFGLILFVKKNNEKVISKKFEEDYVSGEPIYIELAPEWFEFIETPVNETSLEENSTIINETLEENLTVSEVEENEQEEDSKLTGSVIFWEGESLPKRVAYYGIGILVLSLVGFMCIKILKKKKKEPELQKPEKKQDEKKEVKNDKELIEDAERKIKEAQEEIKKIKNEDKIKEAKRKIIEDEKELMRLREGKD